MIHYYTNNDLYENMSTCIPIEQSLNLIESYKIEKETMHNTAIYRIVYIVTQKGYSRVLFMTVKRQHQCFGFSFENVNPRFIIHNRFISLCPKLTKHFK